jgi:hypothetical protein
MPAKIVLLLAFCCLGVFATLHGCGAPANQPPKHPQALTVPDRIKYTDYSQNLQNDKALTISDPQVIRAIIDEINNTTLDTSRYEAYIMGCMELQYDKDGKTIFIQCYLQQTISIEDAGGKQVYYNYKEGGWFAKEAERVEAHMKGDNPKPDAK